MKPSSTSGWIVVVCLVLLAGWRSPSPRADDPNACDVEGEVPDIVVGDLQTILRWASDGVVTAFSVATTSCNQGSCEVTWNRNTPDHPVIGQNMYRLMDGRLQQVGMSWLKHGFFAVSGELCYDDCVGTNGTVLGVHCSDPYSANFNGDQTTLGPRSEVNAATGVFPYPFSTQGQTGNALYKRLQVANADLDPGLNPGARYFIEGQYVNEDDATANTDENNVSYREIVVSEVNGSFSAELSGETIRAVPALHAWSEHQPGVSIVSADIEADGRMTVGSAVMEISPGRFRYDYAVHNLNSHRSGRAFSVPLPVGASVDNVGFHDVDYHSGEPYDGKDWVSQVETDAEGQRIRWATASFETDPDANALRWGTLYNFWFESDAPPSSGPVSMELFRPGMPSQVEWITHAPRVCDEDGVCEPGESCHDCAVDCSAASSTEQVCDDGLDLDCDGAVDCQDTDCCDLSACGTADLDGDGFAGCDCNDDDGSAWTAPGPVRDLRLSSKRGTTELIFVAPLDPGGMDYGFDVLRTGTPFGFAMDAVCLVSGAPDPQALDSDVPGAGQLFHYLARAVNACVQPGSSGATSDGTVRQGRDCP
ncbi:hypothetical protein N9971_00760 [bacterium]|nr:hypothetical protein [bacterium]